MIQNAMECAVDAQSLISISLRKIHSSRTQRGGIRLHKNLLVSYVLRNARQLYMSEKYAEIYRMQQYEEVMTVCNEIQELDPLDVSEECAEQGEECVEHAASLCGALLPAQLHAAPACAVAAAAVSVSLPHGEDACKEPEMSFCRSCCSEPCDFSSSSCSRTTVLDLDTHVVTTVENGCLHQDCCQGAHGHGHAKKRKADFCYFYASEPEECPDFTPCKRARTSDELPGCPGSEQLDTSNISTLISMFGSGFTELVSRQADLEQSVNGHMNGQLCSKQVLASLGAWTRAIVAF
uniref:Immediate early response 5 like n=2 Tax=Scleropages formosus TaxID=113540 RepID=A0A8C9WP20_SCLFO